MHDMQWLAIFDFHFTLKAASPPCLFKINIADENAHGHRNHDKSVKPVREICDVRAKPRDDKN